MWSLFIARRAPENARSPAVISTGGWAVYDVADVPILWAFCCVVDTLSEHCPRRRSSASPLVVAVFRICGSCVNAVQLHVYDADVLVRRGVHGTASDNRRSGRRSDRFAWPRSWRRTG